MMWEIVFILCVSCVLSMPPEMVDLLTPMKELGEGCGYDSCPTTRPGVLNVHVVPHTHYELGHGRTFYEHFTGTDRFSAPTTVSMKRTLDFVVTELWSQRHRTFAFSDFPYFFQWWSKRDPSVRRMVFELLRQGRLTFIGGGWSMNDEATTSYHAIIESFTYSLRKLNATFLECGRPLVAWQSDVMGHSREFANLVSLMGYDALFISPISFDDELARMSRWALEFLWRGSDDLGPESDIFTHKLFDGYWAPPGFCFSTTCGDPLIVTSDTLFANAKERATAFRKSMLTRQGPNYNTSHVLVMMGQVFGYNDAAVWFANIDKLIEEVNKMGDRKTRGVFMAYSSPACYLKAVHDENPTLETKQDDFFPFAYDKSSYLTGFYTSHPPIKLMAREALVFLQMAKQMQVLAKLFDNSPTFEELNWNLGVFQDHLIISGVMRDYVKSYYSHRMYVAVQKSTLLLKQAFNKLRNSPSGTIYYRCSLNISSCHSSRSKYYYIVVYNPLAWTVSMPIRLPVTPGDLRVYLPNGNRVKTDILKVPEHILNLKYRRTESRHELVFIAEKLPPLGFRSYYVEKYTARKKRTLIKNLKRKNNKKFLTMQTGRMAGNDTLFDDLDDYEYLEDLDTQINNDGDIEDDSEPSTTENIPAKKTTIETTTNPDEIRDPAVTQNVLENLMKQSYFGQARRGNLGDKMMSEFVNQKDEKIRNQWLKRFDETKKKLWEEYVKLTKSKEYQNLTVPDIHTAPVVDPYLVQELKAMAGDLSDDNFHPYDDVKKSAVENIADHIEETTAAPFRPPAGWFQTQPRRRLRPTLAQEILRQPEQKQYEVSEPQPHYILNQPKLRDFIDADPKEEAFLLDESREKPDVVTKPTRRKMKQESKAKPETDPLLSDDLFIENKYIRINLDPSSHKVADVTLSNGLQINLDIQFYFYISDDPDRLKKDGVKKPGAYIFRPMDSTPIPILDFLDVKVYKSPLVQEVHFIYSYWASLVVRLYFESAIIEVDWVIGPVPLYDGIGKEVFIRYMTNLANRGVFYTDSNGRQTVKRIRDMRPMYENLNPDQVAGNYYPVTSKIYIEDKEKNLRFAVFNDRAQGGASLYDGEIDLMIQRRLLTDDTGISAQLNDTDFGEGVIVRGKHYLYLSKGDYKPNKIYEKKLAKELELAPQIFMSPPNPDSREKWQDYVNEISFLNNKLPIGVHLLTLEQWNDNTILVRLENYLEKYDIKSTGLKKVSLENLFTNIIIRSVKETTLAGNIWLKDYVKKTWSKKEDFVKNFNDFYGTRKPVEFLNDESYEKGEDVDLFSGIYLAPQQIRTFVCVYDYVEL